MASQGTVSPMVEPNPEAIRAHLEFLFSPARASYGDSLLEIRYGAPGNKLNNWEYFSISEKGVEEATGEIVRLNRIGNNVYVGVNPRKPETSFDNAGNENDIEVCFFQFADIDKAQSAHVAADRCKGLEPSVVVMTGTVPNFRPHLYWKLDEPCTDFGGWRERQSAIAAALGGDSVIDLPRIMRIGGTVNYPTQKKLGDGYRVELTDFRINFSPPRPPRSAEQIANHFPVKVREYDPSEPNGNTRGNIGYYIDEIRAGREWHNNLLVLVAKCLRAGWPDAGIFALAEGLTLSGYTVAETREDIAQMIRTGRDKFRNLQINDPVDLVIEKKTDTEIAQSKALEDSEYPLPLEWFDEIEAQLEANWLVDDLIPSQGLCLVYGHPGSGKSFFALDVAMHVAMGDPWRERDVQQGLVIYIGAEGQRGLRQRVSAFRQHHRIDELPFALIPVEVNLLSNDGDLPKIIETIRLASDRFNLPVAMVVVDTLSRTFGGGDEVGPDMVSYINNVGRIQAAYECATMVIHHRPKDSANTTPRGHGSLWGACDTIILVDAAGPVKMASVTKQKDADAGEPIPFKLHVVELGNDEKGRPVTSCVVVAANEAVQQKAQGPKLSDGQQIAVAQLKKLVADKGNLLHHGVPKDMLPEGFSTKVCSLSEWRERTTQVLYEPDSTPDSLARNFRRYREKLQKLNIIGVFEDFVWFIDR